MISFFITIASILLLIAFVIAISFLIDEKKGAPMVVFVLTFLSGVIIVSLVGDSRYPSAMDVYRGKTTLKISYQDSIAVDSVVVYK